VLGQQLIIVLEIPIQTLVVMHGIKAIQILKHILVLVVMFGLEAMLVLKHILLDRRNPTHMVFMTYMVMFGNGAMISSTKRSLLSWSSVMAYMTYMAIFGNCVMISTKRAPLSGSAVVVAITTLRNVVLLSATVTILPSGNTTSVSVPPVHCHQRNKRSLNLNPD